ncbi:hypothetical protein CEX73_00670 [Candidatus Palibaumannia cicadellinicola]|uniref:Solute-binding protein family 3/N-terminal domain-containing protein n=1 Tax=Candidatus Palibaumannia cicadellinicola TaxID=186490 RepID=A0A2N4XXF9_9GAMM|nr:hypothetical protein CEX73_00670 [Candidatus Baumannia cicadellinicola]
MLVITKNNKTKFYQTDLTNKRIGTQNGSTHQKYLMDKYPKMTIRSYDSYQNAMLDLKNSRIDGIFGDTAVVNQWIKTDNSLITIGDKIIDPNYFGTGLGIAIRKDNLVLVQKLNKALISIKQDGTYQMIYQKWFNNSVE